MGLFLKQNEPRSQLQSKIAADLSERLKAQSMDHTENKPQPAILDNQRPTSSLAWLWILLVVVGITGGIFVLAN